MKINYLAAFFCSIFIFFAACTKITSTDIGTGLIPAVDSVITKDTFISVVAKNAGDSTISPALSQIHVVGFVDDPLFGKTNARINFQLSLPNSNFRYLSTGDSNLTLDSVVLVLSYNGIWGDSNRPVPLYVNEIDKDETFLPDTITTTYDPYTGFLPRYNNVDNFNASSQLTTTPAVVYPTKLDDTIRVFQDSGANMIRIPLNNGFGQRLVTADTSVYKNDSTFRNELRGLQVYTDESSAALLKIGLTDANTKLAIYYRYRPKDSASTVLVPNVRYFKVNTTSAHSNHIERIRSTGQINNYLPSDPATKNDDLIFIQAGPGTYATITIDSGLAKLSNAIIHRAELLMDQAEDPSDLYLSPPNLFLLAKDDTSRFVIPGSDTNNISTADAIFSSSYLANYTDFGGVPKKNTTNNSLYAFNLSRYVQGILTRGNKLHPLVLYAPYNEPFKLLQSMPFTSARGYVSNSPTNTAGCGRVRLHGGDGDGTGNTHNMRLHIVYSVPH